MNKRFASDEEEDLESLRLAALQSLKRKNQDISGLHYSNSNFRGRITRNKWGRFGSQQRPGKSGHFNRFRNTNLIPITPISMEPDKSNPTIDSETRPNLPKKSSVEDQTKEEECSKFTRYDKSDKSESESDEEENAEDAENLGGPLKKSDSLEALMQELDDEIQGKIKSETSDTEKPPKAKKIKKKQKIPEENEKVIEPPPNEEPKEGIATPKEESTNKVEKEEDPKTENTFDHKNIRPNNQRRFMKKQRIHPPRPHLMFNPPNHYAPPVLPPYMNPPYIPPFMQNNHNIPHLPPLYFDRPLSPLSINAESLATAAMAPLSPRSAAFVLENKAIIERRKRSPRRSYSRSPSRSPSPRYSLSPPRRFRRSVSPRRSPRRFSPRKRSLSPRRSSMSPSRKPAYNKQRTKLDKPEENVKIKEKEDNDVQNREVLDPVLEARKRKFESNEIKKKEGIIRLKPKTESISTNETPKGTEAVKESDKTAEKTPIPKTEKASKPEEEKPKVQDPVEFQELEKLLFDDDPAPEEVEVNHKVVDIFSDEESDSDNEGRFKVKQKRGEKVPMLPFNKLLNGTIRDVKCTELPDSSRPRREKDKRTRYGQKEIVQPEIQSKKQKISVKNEKNERPEKNLEVKIRNPVKQEKSEKKKDKMETVESKSDCMAIDEDEIVLEGIEVDSGTEESCDDENVTLKQGDLRTQLSRKRAEKLHRLPAEEVSTRILKFALEGAVLKKSKKKSKKKALSRREVKLPIHLRLGINNATDIFEDVKVKKKSKKRKNREVLKQV